MSLWTTETPVAEFVTARPRAARVLEKLRLDFCCGGKRPLREACAEKGLDPEAVLRDLLADSHGPFGGEKEPDWRSATLAALTDDIVATHHAFLRREIPRLTALLQKVVRAHAERHPELRQVQEIFQRFVAEMHAHMFKEEAILFPALRQIEAGEDLLGFPCGSIDGPIAEMEREHDQAGDALKGMRYLTAGFTPPGDACGSYRALLEGLAGVEADMHIHVHKENNILFPQALEARGRLAKRP